MQKLNTEYFEKYTAKKLFDTQLTKAQKKDKEKFEQEITKLDTEIKDIKSNKIYERAFEWRFEFPEVLDNDGRFIGFDIIIGNPPYINAIDFKKMVGEDEYFFYKKEYETAKGAVDIYIYFFEKGYQIANENGYLSFISPNRYLSANYAVALREYLLNRTKFITLGDYSNVRVFKEASTYPVITILKKQISDSEYFFKSFTYKTNLEYTWREFKSLQLRFLPDNILGHILSEKFTIAQKVINSSISITAAGKINATSTAGEAESYHSLINKKKGFKLINTGTIDRYTSLWGQNYLIDKGEKYLKPYLPMDATLLSKNRYDLYSRPKIIFAKIAIRVEAFYDEFGEYSSINTNCMHSFNPNYDPIYILSWLNSKLFQYIFECFYEGLKMSGGFLLYSAPNLSYMYLPDIPLFDQKKFVEITRKILTEKSNKAKSETTKLEQEIDQLVYQLYNLTEEEIKIVEGK